jgi:quercetin dioxygenase-like cupin family protein
MTDTDGAEAGGTASGDGAERESGPEPLLRRAGDVEYEAVGAAEGLRKGVLVGPDDGAPRFALRRFTLAPGATVPRHTNAVEHEQYVLAGEYVVGVGDEERVVREGDSLLIPAGVVHWYRNEGDTEGAFLCAVPNGDDAIELLEDG